MESHTRSDARTLLELGLLEFGLQYLSLSRPDGEVQLAANGNGPTGANREKLRVKTSQGHNVSVEYQFASPPDEEARRDVAACLARLVEQGRLD